MVERALAAVRNSGRGEAHDNRAQLGFAKPHGHIALQDTRARSRQPKKPALSSSLWRLGPPLPVITSTQRKPRAWQLIGKRRSAR